MHRIENKSSWKDEMRCGDTGYKGIKVWVEHYFAELKSYVCVWLIYICIIK